MCIESRALATGVNTQAVSLLSKAWGRKLSDKDYTKAVRGIGVTDSQNGGGSLGTLER